MKYTSNCCNAETNICTDCGEHCDVVEDSMMPITGNDTWEDRFNMEFVDEDTGLLNISKYDHERLINFIKNETS